MFRFQPQVVDSGAAQVIDTSPLLRAMQESNRRKLQHMREDKQRAEAEYNLKEEQLSDLIGLTQGEDGSIVDEKIIDAQKWMSELNEKGERINTPKNKAEYRRRVNEIKALSSRSKSSHQAYLEYKAQIAENPYASEGAQEALFTEYKKSLSERSLDEMKRIYLESYDINKFLEKSMTDSESEKGIYTIYDKIQRVNDKGKVELYTDELLIKDWATDDGTPQKTLAWEMAVDRMKERVRQEQDARIQNNEGAFSIDSKDPSEARKAQLLNGNLSLYQQRKMYIEDYRNRFRESYGVDKDKIYKRTQGEVQSDNLNKSITNMGSYIASGGDVKRVLQSFAGASKEPLESISKAQIKSLSTRKDNLNTQLTTLKKDKKTLEDSLANIEDEKEREKVDAKIETLNSKIRGVEDEYNMVSGAVDYELPEGDTHVIAVYDYGYEYDENTGEQLKDWRGTKGELKPRYISYNANDPRSVERALHNVASMRPSAVFGLKNKVWSGPSVQKKKEEEEEPTGEVFEPWNK